MKPGFAPRFSTSTGQAVRLLFSLVAWVAVGRAHAQAPAAAPLCIGETFTLTSKALGETRRLNVYVPPIYRDSATIRLPVLYMPDGGMAEDFLHVAGLVQVVKERMGLVEPIVVGDLPPWEPVCAENCCLMPRRPAGHGSPAGHGGEGGR